MSEHDLPSGNANLPPGTDWITEQGSIDGGDKQVIDFDTERRWMLLRSGEEVMWGEGYFGISFREMAERGHYPGSYSLLVGEKVGAVPENEYNIVTPNGDVVGTVRGTVSHKATAEVSPDVRCEVMEDE